MSSMGRSVASYVDPKRQYRPEVSSTKSITPVPLLPSNPFYNYDVSSWDCFPNTASTHGETSSVSSSSSIERGYRNLDRNPNFIRVIKEHTKECFNITTRMARWYNCLKRKRLFIRKMLKVVEKSCEVDFSYIESVRKSLRRNEKIQLMFREYSYDKWRPYEGKRPRGHGKRRR